VNINLQTRISDAKHWSWTLKLDIVKFKENLATAMSMRPSTNGWTIQQERFFSNQSAQEHSLLIDAGNFFKAAHNLKASTNTDLENRVRHLRNIHEHWEDNRKYFTGEENDLSVARASVRWFKTNFPDANPYSRGWSNASGYDIGGILNPDNVLREIASVESVIRQKVEELRAN
jgi:DNA segregation ATPase FtsK/SpoIIIE-like protein